MAEERRQSVTSFSMRRSNVSQEPTYHSSNLPAATMLIFVFKTANGSTSHRMQEAMKLRTQPPSCRRVARDGADAPELGNAD
jgi:hypothetical protein